MALGIVVSTLLVGFLSKRTNLIDGLSAVSVLSTGDSHSASQRGKLSFLAQLD